jgi:putative transposase
MCEVLGVSASGYYAWRGRPLFTPRARANRGLQAKIRAIFAEHRARYGSPRIHAALRHAGERVGRNRVIRLMQAADLRARPRRRFQATTDADPAATPARNHLNQCFRVSAPNVVWAADITALPTSEGWLYLAVVMDLYSRRVIGWAVDRTLATRLVMTAWQRARARRGIAPALHHSDRGSQYTSATFQRALAEARVRCSMSRRGNCWDNAPVESFFRTLKTELGLDVSGPQSRPDVAATVGDYIERFYNARRLHSALGYRSPAQFEAARGAAA